MRMVLFTILALSLTAPLTAVERPILAINEDNDHYFKFASGLMTERDLVDYVDRIIGPGQVTDFVMCPCGQRTSYDSQVWEPIWAGLDEPDVEGRTNNIWCVNAKLLHDRGIDPYAVWLRRCREKGGVRTWLSMRMNDVHFVNITNYFRNTTFQKTRREGALPLQRALPSQERDERRLWRRSGADARSIGKDVNQRSRWLTWGRIWDILLTKITS